MAEIRPMFATYSVLNIDAASECLKSINFSSNRFAGGHASVIFLISLEKVSHKFLRKKHIRQQSVAEKLMLANYYSLNSVNTTSWGG
jgi:hypothetical protein